MEQMAQRMTERMQKELKLTDAQAKEVYNLNFQQIKEMQAMREKMREARKADGQERIYTHGEKEVAAVKRIMENGIPVNDNTMVEVLDLCNYLGMDFGAYFGDYRPPVKKDVFKGNY